MAESSGSDWCMVGSSSTMTAETRSAAEARTGIARVLGSGRLSQLVLPNDGTGIFYFLNRAPIRFISIESGFGGGLQDLLP